nr:epoxide hydrolase N-terminal domain-containing protein [Actinomadura oligospora]
MTNDSTTAPFRIGIPQADLDDLQQRLARTRWAEELPAGESAPPDHRALGLADFAWDFQSIRTFAVAAHDAPDLFVGDIRQLFGKVR